jgi:NTP pyrophosphatase (non-canonical NTP hydrolase)
MLRNRGVSISGSSRLSARVGILEQGNFCRVTSRLRATCVSDENKPMTELSTASIAHIYTAIELTQTGAILKSGHFFDTIGKTVLKLPDSTILQQLTATLPSSQVIEAMQRLVELVAKLRSPDGGCPSDLEPSPANLAPYLSEETQEVLEALQVQTSPTVPPISPPPLLSVEDLIPQLLWSIAHSSYRVVQLIEGVNVSSGLAGSDWRGMLRLVTQLEAETSDRRWGMDLVTHQPSSSACASDTTVQIHWNGMAQVADVPTISTDQLLEDLTRSLSEASPLVQALLDGLAVGLLEPEKGWQSGQLWLKLSFELIVDRQDDIEIEPALDFAATVPNFSDKTVDEPTLEDFANCVELNESQRLLHGNEFGVTLADFTGDMIAAIAPTNLEEADEFATLEEFALALAPAIVNTSNTTDESFLPGTLADFALEIMQPEPALVEVLSAEPIVIVDEPHHSNNISQTIEVASIEIPPLGTDLFEQWELTYTPQAIVASETINGIDVLAETSPEPAIVLRLVDPAWQLLQVQQLTQQRLMEALKLHETVPLDELPFWLVEQAWKVSEQLASQAEQVPEQYLQAWLPEVLWQVTRVSLEVMQLVGGLTARVLQPHWDWKLGTLRLLPLLRIQTTNLEWALDVVTGEPLQPNSLPVDPTAIVRLAQPYMGTQSMLAESLFGKAIEQIRAKAPEIQQLMDGICMEVCFAKKGWQAAKLQLHFNLELITE